ncbi:hypothetical protein KIP88_33605 [Bradyrhizobium sp. SRL28]|uniref:hypothetical protein n=1 Tax=Bradyrhizobium sp. SRL28 TaxID=2836178 RepID=UPI001BDE141E|nr:hypothetical protein [Bradyrhizobium sp. SRL28]MBT1515422.1 hypothetical protein [Bradyrhizobium sp. SRL28]
MSDQMHGFLTLPAGAIAGWDLHPLEIVAFTRRTPGTDMAGNVCPSFILLNVSNIDQCFENRKSMLVLSPFRIHFHRIETAATNQQRM